MIIYSSDTIIQCYMNIYGRLIIKRASLVHFYVWVTRFQFSAVNVVYVWITQDIFFPREDIFTNQMYCSVLWRYNITLASHSIRYSWLTHLRRFRRYPSNLRLEDLCFWMLWKKKKKKWKPSNKILHLIIHKRMYNGYNRKWSLR